MKLMNDIFDLICTFLLITKWYFEKCDIKLVINMLTLDKSIPIE